MSLRSRPDGPVTACSVGVSDVSPCNVVMVLDESSSRSGKAVVAIGEMPGESARKD